MATKKKITTLTEAQAARVVTWRAEWLAHGCNTAPADRPRAQAAITAMYEVIGEKPPVFLWFDSPMAAALAAGLLKSVSEKKPLKAELDSQLDSQLYSQLGSQLYSQLYYSQLGSQLYSQLDSQLDSQLGSQLVSQLYSQLYSQLRSHARSAVNVRMATGWWIGWVAFYTYLQDVLGLEADAETTRRLGIWKDYLQSGFWFMPYQGMCFCSERPSAIHWDERARLHHPSEAALQFRDGYRMFMWHGTNVPEPWITAPDKLDVTAALNWQNIEQRRAAAEIIGWKRILDTLPHRIIDADKDPYIGTLMEVDLPDSPKEKFLRVRCGTGRDFVLPVDPKSKTALEANARTYRLKPNEYKLEART
jgi:hypothetical protein